MATSLHVTLVECLRSRWSLHTRQQDLGRHVLLHALVAGGALTEGGAWVRPKKGFLFPVRALSKVFRGKLIGELDALHGAQRWPAGIVGARLKPHLYDHDWVVYAKQSLGGPKQALEYLGRYTHQVAISNERIVGIEGDDVAFRVRADPERGKRRTIRLAGPKFIGRFLPHVLPAGFKRIRHYGLLSAARKKVGLAAARAALAVQPPEPAVIELAADFLRRVARFEHKCCPACGSGTFQVVAALLPERRRPVPRAPP